MGFLDSTTMMTVVITKEFVPVSKICAILNKLSCLVAFINGSSMNYLLNTLLVIGKSLLIVTSTP